MAAYPVGTEAIQIAVAHPLPTYGAMSPAMTRDMITQMRAAKPRGHELMRPDMAAILGDPR